ncbi:MAG: OmpA family protein [Alphaproteobacteria bacterium]|nr:OmpA family protein [Alphaproteobacteria bacterium]
MKIRSLLLAGSAIAGLTCAAQAGELRGTYFALEGGASWVGGENFFQDIFFTTGATTHSDFSSEFETGWSLFGTVGYAFDGGVRAELEAGYRRNAIDQLFSTAGSPLSAEGKLGEFTLMANLLYDLQLSKQLSATIGVGAGADLARLEVAEIGFKDNDWTFAYQGLFGLNYAIGERTQLFLNYRYLRADAPDYNEYLGGAPASSRNVAFHGDLEKQTVTMGLRFALYGAPETTVVPPSAPPPPPPVVPTAPKEFIVFFGYDKSDLSAEAQRVVADAAFAAKEHGAAAILIVGHTDSMGSNIYNEALSLRRAHSVRSALTKLGIAADTISASGKGESELLVRTGDRVKEPQNRRATINLQ